MGCTLKELLIATHRTTRNELKWSTSILEPVHKMPAIQALDALTPASKNI